MARNQIDMGSVSLPTASAPSVSNPADDFDFNSPEAQQMRSQAISEMPQIQQVQSDESTTSAGRLNQMLQSNSPLMQRASTQGQQMANQRGLLNSSMAAGAAQGAMIDRAQPFALQDSSNLMQNQRQDSAAQNEQAMLQSSTLADSFLRNQQFQQEGALNQQGMDIQAGLAQQQSGLQSQRDAQQFNYESGLIGQQADIQAERDQRIASLDQEQTRLQADLQEAAAQNDLGRQQELNEQQAQIQTERDELLFDQDLDRTAQDYGLRSDILRQEGEQTLERLYGTSMANAWGVMGNNVTDIVAQAMIEISNIQNNPNIDADDKTEMIGQIQDARDADVEFQAELFSTFPTTLQNTNIFPSSVG